MIARDFKCSRCGETFEDLVASGAKEAKCRCGGKGKVVFAKAASYQPTLETWLESQRGHLSHKIARSVRRDQARLAEVQKRRARVPDAERIG